MKKNVIDILDIHTHKQEVDTQGKSIINYPLLADSPLYMPLAENVGCLLYTSDAADE